MLAGLLGSRALGSIGVMLFGLNGIRGVALKDWLKLRWWLFGLGWLGLFLLSWLWSDNGQEWEVQCQAKMPFLVLTLGFSLLPRFSQRHIHAFTLILFGLMLCGCGWSLAHLIREPEVYVKGYGVSHLLPTPAYNDHIAFSTLIAFCVAWGIYQLPRWRGILRWAGLLVLLFFAAYLHILAAKTGLLTLYVFVLAYLALLLVRGYWKQVLPALAGCALLVGLAYAAIPTFRTRIGYMAYAANEYRAGNRTGDYGDIGRLISYKVSGQIIAAQPLLGVGAGDMLAAMKQGYGQYYPQVADKDQLLPHNDFLVLALGAGIPCALLFIIWILMPLIRLRRWGIDAIFVPVWLMLLVPLMVDTFTEVQWGVLVYLLPFLWMMKVARGNFESRISNSESQEPVIPGELLE